MEKTNEIIEMARKYRTIGWQVIPLFNYSKNPAPIKWKDFQETMLSEEQFEELFQRPNLTGLGVLTGRLSGIVVLDEDLYKEGGIKVGVRTGMMARSARGGQHHFFKYIEPIKSSGLREGIFVEIKADGGFLVLPPSKVQLPDGTIGDYTWVDKCALDEMMEIREVDLEPYRPGVKNAKTIDLMSLVHAPLGTQHNNLRSFTLSVLNRFNPKEWDIAQEVIRRQAELFDPPHPPERVEKMIQDCMTFIQLHPKEVEKEVENAYTKPQGINEMVEERWMDKELEKNAAKTGYPELDELIGGFVPMHVITLTGDTNVGKTTIAANFAEALRLQGRKTLYIALEPDNVIVDYLASIRHVKPFKELTKEDLFVEDDQYIKVFRQQDIRSPQDLVRALKNEGQQYDLIVIDHIGYFVHGEKNWIQEQSNIIKELAFLSKSFKTCVMMIAHLRKPGFQKKNQDWVPTQNDIAGSAAFKQDSQEVLIAYRPVKEQSFGIEFQNQGRILVTKTKHGPNGSFPIYFVPLCARIFSEQEAIANPIAADKVYDSLRQAEKETLDYNMAVSSGWKDEEVDTGNDN